MTIAPWAAGWSRRMRNLPGPLMGGSDRGVPFLRKSPGFSALYPSARLVVEMAWGADITADPSTWPWTDITEDLLQGDSQVISISPMGRSDNTSKTQPAACSFTVGANESAIRYMKGPQSPNYPNVHQNVPVRVWVTLTGAMNDMQVQFQGEAWSMKPTWNKRGNVAFVTIRAAGKMRQLAQGTSPLKSALTRAISGINQFGYKAFAHWPCEDSGNATQISAATPNTNPAAVTGSISFASYTGALGSAPLPTLNDGALISGTYPPATLVADLNGNTGFLVHMVATVPSSISGDAAFLEIDVPATGGDNVTRIAIEWINSLTSLCLTWRNASGALINSANLDFTATPLYDTATLFLINISTDVIGDPGKIHAGITAWQGSPVIPVNFNVGSWTAPAPVPPPTAWRANGTAHNAGWAFGHHALYADSRLIQNPISPVVSPALTGFNSETVTARLTRLCREQGVRIDITGTSVTLMGPQTVDTFINLIRECEAADQGLLGDGMGPGCYYITRSIRYNLGATIVLDARTGGDLADAPAPEDDDQKLRNRYTVTRKNGSSAVYEDTDGPLGTATVGTYDSTPGGDLNLASDTRLHGIAAWLVHLGTVEGYRYPTLPLDFRTAPGAAPGWIVMRPGNRLTVNNVDGVSPEHPAGPVDVLAEGWSQQLSPYVWTAVVNCSQAAAWDVAVVADSRYRVDSNQSTVSGTVSPGDTTMTVTGHTWSTDTPYDVRVAGWQVTVTAVSGTTFTIDPAPGTLPDGAAVTMWRPATVALD